MKLFFDDEKGQRGAFALGTARVTIGRSSDCELVLPDERVSRVHARIESVSGQHLLQDAGSSNGTFLNGMRLRSETSAALREGDVVEIGGTRFRYGTAESSSAPPRPSSVVELSSDAYPLSDLLRDGAARVEAAAEERAEVLRAFVGVSPVVALERCLEIVSRRVGVDSVAVFMKGPGDEIQAVAWRPGPETARCLADIARRAWTSREGRLVRGLAGGGDAEDVRETAVRPLYSSGAAPFFDGPHQALGVLAVERVHEKRIDRVELAQLASMGDAIAQTIALGDRSPDETSLSFGARAEESRVGSVAP